MLWHPWSDEAFERTRERGCPVLLFLRASWCRWCRELEETVLRDARVAAVLGERYVCIEVDKDAHPEIDARYRRGGWPTLAWLDADREVLASTNYLPASELHALLGRVADAYGDPGETIAEIVQRAEASAAERVPPASPSGTADRSKRPAQLSSRLVEEVTAAIVHGADPVHGGWGTRHKFPHAEAVQFATVRWTQTGDLETRAVVLRTLHRMQAGEIHDTVEGGFYRYATQPDWSGPQHEKMLDSNAERLIVYVQAYQVFGESSFLETAQGILRWMHGTMYDPETRAFRGRQDADPEYAHLKSVEARARRGAPACDPTLFCNWNAMAVSALLESAIVLGEDRHRAEALATLDFLMENLWDPRQGMYHYWDGTYNLPGMLSDQAHTLRALVAAMHYAGENRYLAQAEALARRTIEHMQAPDGAFYDETHGKESGRRVLGRSILDNAVMAEALLRLAWMTREASFETSARAALASFLPDYKSFGPFIAGYGRAVDLLVHPPVHVTIVGHNDEDHTRALRVAALHPYVANRIVQTIDPRVDPGLFALSGLPEPRQHGARAYFHQGRSSYAETSKPERIPALMARIERSN